MRYYAKCKHLCEICQQEIKGYAYGYGQQESERMSMRHLLKRIEKHEKTDRHIINIEVQKYINAPVD